MWKPKASENRRLGSLKSIYMQARLKPLEDGRGHVEETRRAMRDDEGRDEGMSDGEMHE